MGPPSFLSPVCDGKAYLVSPQGMSKIIAEVERKEPNDIKDAIASLMIKKAASFKSFAARPGSDGSVAVHSGGTAMEVDAAGATRKRALFSSGGGSSSDGQPQLKAARASVSRRAPALLSIIATYGCLLTYRTLRRPTELASMANVQHSFVPLRRLIPGPRRERVRACLDRQHSGWSGSFLCLPIIVFSINKASSL